MSQIFKRYIHKNKIQIKRLTQINPVEFFKSPRLTLSGGTDVVLRRASVADITALVHMHERLSSDTRYFRFLRPYKPQVQEINMICRLSDPEGAAFVAQIIDPSNTIIGLAHYIRDFTKSGVAAEPAILIEDRFQGNGLGTALFTHLCRQARAKGIASLHAYSHPRNAKARRILNKGPHPIHETRHSDVVESRIDLSLKIRQRGMSFWDHISVANLFDGCDLGLNNKP